MILQSEGGDFQESFRFAMDVVGGKCVYTHAIFKFVQGNKEACGV